MALDAGITNALVGHGHPRVTEAIARQLAEPEEGIRERYFAALLAKFPASLSICYLVHSTNEATELALRLARTHRPGKDVIVHADTDYGMTTSLASMSPARRKFWVQAASRTEASDVAAKAQTIVAGGRGLGAFFAGGVFETGYLKEAYASVRAVGGLNIALEEQTGMGRVGEAFWEFARHGVTPDIVVIGDSMGSGFPMSAVVTRADLAANSRHRQRRRSRRAAQRAWLCWTCFSHPRGRRTSASSMREALDSAGKSMFRVHPSLWIAYGIAAS